MFSEMIDFLLGYTTVTDIQEAFGQIVQQEAMAYPNPVSTFTNISFDLDESSDVSLAIYDEMGKLVQLISKSGLAAGHQEIGWNTSNLQGQAVDNGIYFYKLTFSGKSASGKLIVQR
jgi:flagellar hook assembly protein FlgD